MTRLRTLAALLGVAVVAATPGAALAKVHGMKGVTGMHHKKKGHKGHHHKKKHKHKVTSGY